MCKFQKRPNPVSLAASGLCPAETKVSVVNCEPGSCTLNEETREFLSIVGDYGDENCAKVGSASAHKKESTLLFTELETSGERKREDAENIILDKVLISAHCDWARRIKPTGRSTVNAKNLMHVVENILLMAS